MARYYFNTVSLTSQVISGGRVRRNTCADLSRTIFSLFVGKVVGNRLFFFDGTLASEKNRQIDTIFVMPPGRKWVGCRRLSIELPATQTSCIRFLVAAEIIIKLQQVKSDLSLRLKFVVLSEKLEVLCTFHPLIRLACDDLYLFQVEVVARKGFSYFTHAYCDLQTHMCMVFGLVMTTEWLFLLSSSVLSGIFLASAVWYFRIALSSLKGQLLCNWSPNWKGLTRTVDWFEEDFKRQAWRWYRLSAAHYF